MTPPQIAVLFPRGLIGLRENLPHAIHAPSRAKNNNKPRPADEDASRSWVDSTDLFDYAGSDLSQLLVFPSADGVVHLLPNRHYTLKPLDLANASMQDHEMSCEPAPTMLFAVTDEEAQPQGLSSQQLKEQQHHRSHLLLMCHTASSHTAVRSNGTTHPWIQHHSAPHHRGTHLCEPDTSLLDATHATHPVMITTDDYDRSLQVGVVYDVGTEEHGVTETGTTHTAVRANADDGDDEEQNVEVQAELMACVDRSNQAPAKKSNQSQTHTNNNNNSSNSTMYGRNDRQDGLSQTGHAITRNRVDATSAYRPVLHTHDDVDDNSPAPAPGAHSTAPMGHVVTEEINSCCCGGHACFCDVCQAARATAHVHPETMHTCSAHNARPLAQERRRCGAAPPAAAVLPESAWRHAEHVALSATQVNTSVAAAAMAASAHVEQPARLHRAAPLALPHAQGSRNETAARVGGNPRRADETPLWHGLRTEGHAVCSTECPSTHPVQRCSGGSDTTHTQGYPVEVCCPAMHHQTKMHAHAHIYQQDKNVHIDDNNYYYNINMHMDKNTNKRKDMVPMSLDDERMPSAVRPDSELRSCTPESEETTTKRVDCAPATTGTQSYHAAMSRVHADVCEASSSMYHHHTRRHAEKGCLSSCTPSSSSPRLYAHNDKADAEREVGDKDEEDEKDDRGSHTVLERPCHDSKGDPFSTRPNAQDRSDVRVCPASSHIHTPDTAPRHSGGGAEEEENTNDWEGVCAHVTSKPSQLHTNHTHVVYASHDPSHDAMVHSKDEHRWAHGETRHGSAPCRHDSCHHGLCATAPMSCTISSYSRHHDRRDKEPDCARYTNATPALANAENTVGVLMTGMRVSYSPEERRLREQEDDMRGDPPHIPLYQPREFKLIKDCIYEHVQLPMLAIRIIDTPEFQRLRTLKQLGTTWLLYPGATHTRFEHSIGVAHLASQMVRHIALRQPELRISEADVLCVAIAGLCHDLGHGPFSHLFEHTVHHMEATKREHVKTQELRGGRSRLPWRTADAGGLVSRTQQAPHIRRRSGVHCPVSKDGNNNDYDSDGEEEKTTTKDGAVEEEERAGERSCRDAMSTAGMAHSPTLWRHEAMSIRLLRRILSRIQLADYGLNEADAQFMELCIAGLPPRARWPPHCGRPAHKRFLVDIVANKRHGIDVDKLDYFLRDSHSVFGRAAVDVNFHRLVSACRVLPYDGELQICFEEKMALSLGDIFALRAKLHKYVYQHRLVKITDSMVQDILTAADPYFRVRGRDQLPCRISDCVRDEEAFCRLGDWILDAIAAAEEPALRPAQALIERLYRRQLYTIASSAMFSHTKPGYSEGKMKNELMDIMRRDLDMMDSGDGGALGRAAPSTPPSPALSCATLEQILIVCFLTITYGSSDDTGRPNDPINEVTFFNPKKMALGAFKLPRNRVSPLFCPSEYSEQSVLVMVRDDAYADAAARAMDVWKSRHAAYLMIGVPSSNTGLASYTRNKSASVSAHAPCVTPDTGKNNHNSHTMCHSHPHHSDNTSINRVKNTHCLHPTCPVSQQHNSNCYNNNSCHVRAQTTTTTTHTATNKSATRPMMTDSSQTVHPNDSRGVVSHVSQPVERAGRPVSTWAATRRECDTVRPKRARDEEGPEEDEEEQWRYRASTYGTAKEAAECGRGMTARKKPLCVQACNGERQAHRCCFARDAM